MNAKRNLDISKEGILMGYSTFDFLHAAAYGNTDEVRNILDSGVDVNACNNGSRETALMTEAGGGKGDALVRAVGFVPEQPGSV